MNLTTEQVRHVALLARVAMTEQELERMREDVSHIFASFDVLDSVDVSSVEPTGHSIDLTSVMREDASRPSQSVEDTLANAPRQEDAFIRVRAVLE